MAIAKVVGLTASAGNSRNTCVVAIFKPLTALLY